MKRPWFIFGFVLAAAAAAWATVPRTRNCGYDSIPRLTCPRAFEPSGATPAPASGVTVNGASAVTYGDFTFASTNNWLNDGPNTFAVVGQNTYGQRVTNNLTVSLPAAVTLQWDSNGNLTNDATRSFFFEAENQLTNVTVVGAWKSEFVYDGLGRRRIERDYAWQAGAWVKTNETRLVYDAMLVIQERDSNNVPLLTYTRGLDVSGDLQTARGVGGLLARTDGNGSTFYHADGAGNITALMDGQENMAARYLYGPFGKLLGKWGPLADANAMQFSSMPRHASSGLSLYPFRGYDPTLQRFLNRDPIGEMGGINLYGFVGNSPLNGIDPLGLAWLWMSPDGRVHTDMPPSEQPTADPISYGALHGYGDITGGQRTGDFFLNDFVKPAAEKSLEVGAAIVPVGGTEAALGKEVAEAGLLAKLKGLASRCEFWKPKQAEALGHNAADFEKLKDALRAQMSKPHATDPYLKHLLDDLYRPGAKVGSGSTAEAVRAELATGQQVGGRFHSQKAEDAIRALGGWLRNNPTASASDRAAAENVIRDLRNALEGR